MSGRDPAWLVAKYNFIWGNDNNALTNYFKDVEEREKKDRLDMAMAKEKEALRLEQEEDKKNSLLERFQTAQTSYLNARVLYDTSLKEKGPHDPGTVTARNNLDQAQWTLDNLSKKLDIPVYTPTNDMPDVTSSDTPAVTSSDTTSTDSASISRSVSSLQRKFNEGSNITDQEILSLELEPNITEQDKDKLSKLRLSIRARNKSSDLQSQISRATRNLGDHNSRRLLKNNGYEVQRSGSGWIWRKKGEKTWQK